MLKEALRLGFSNVKGIEPQKKQYLLLMKK